MTAFHTLFRKVPRPLAAGLLLGAGLLLHGPAPTATTASAPEPGILFVLDASGSMWGRVADREKIVIAREVLTRLINDLPEDVQVGLEVYGHRREKDCGDIELLAPLGAESRETLVRRIQAITPKGRTPLTEALKQAADHLTPRGATAAIVLVSDGKESCQGDPCALVRRLRATGLQVTTHVVGFDVGPEEREQLACIAEAGGGRYFTARDADQLRGALVVVQEAVIARSRAEGETLWLNTYASGNNGFAGPVVSQATLEAGGAYRITVEGTFSSWSARESATICAGSAEARPRFPSPDTPNGQATRDAAYLFAVPASWTPGCGKALPVASPAFELSLDGGKTWAPGSPVTATFNADHVYAYEVTGAGHPLQIRHPDAPTSDNYGQLKVHCQRIDAPAG